jgi:type IV pilus assembly protein PilQ
MPKVYFYLLALFALATVASAQEADSIKIASTLPAKAEASAVPDPAAAQGTVVISSASEAEADPYADEALAEDDAPATPTLQVSKDPATGLLTIDAPSEDIRRVVRQVADLYELNIVVPENLNGATTLRLRNVSWKQLFEVMLPPVGFSYIEDNNIILIKSREELSAEPTETRVFLINYATASELAAAITPLIDASNGGRIQVDRRSNALVVTERPSRFNNIKDIIDRLDRSTPQVLIESKFIEITDNDAKNLGLDWTSLNNYKLSAGPFSREWSRGDTAASDFSSYADSAVFSAPVFNVVLSSLSTLTGANLISNPTVVALNNTEAIINIGEEYPVPEYSYNDQQGVFEVSGFSYKPIGINLKVTPQVNSQGFITLNIAPELSSRSGEVTFAGASGAKIPIISTRKTSSTINIKDGYTLAIGGLIETKENSTTVKVPILGDIPLAGRAFQNENKTKDRRNLVIFITARTVNPDGSGASVLDPRVMAEMGLTPSDLPGYVPTAAEQKLMDDLAAKREALKRAAQLKSLHEQLGEGDTPQPNSSRSSSTRAR